MRYSFTDIEWLSRESLRSYKSDADVSLPFAFRINIYGEYRENGRAFMRLSYVDM